MTESRPHTEGPSTQALCREDPSAEDDALGAPAADRRLITAAWLVIAACAALYLVGYGLEAPAGLLVRGGALLTVVLCGAVSSTIVWRRAARAHAGYVMRFWGPLALAEWLLFLGESYYCAYQLVVDPRGPSWPSIYNLLNLLAALAFAGLLVSMNRVGRLPPTSRARVWAGIVGTLVVSYVATFWFVVEPLASANGYGHVDAALWSLYIIEGLLLAIVPFSTLFGLKLSSWRPWQRCVGAALTVFGASLLLVPAWLASPGGSRESPWAAIAGVAYVLAHGLLFAGALYRLGDTERAGSTGPLPAPHFLDRPIFEAIASGVAFLAIVIMSRAIAQMPEGSFARSLLFGGVAVATAALTLRVAVGAAEMQTMRVRASTDPLTGALHRGALIERLKEVLRQAADETRPVSLGVLDLDDFARFNVMEGREAGDNLLVEVGNAVRSRLAAGEMFGRLGGDEFCIVLPGLAAHESVQRVVAMADGVRQRLRDRGWLLTVSAGVASVPEHASDEKSLLLAADGALYWAKYGGKNRVVVYDEAVIRALDAEARLRELDTRSRVDIVRALAAATDARDQATSYHSRNVAALCVMLATALDLDADRIEDIRLAAVLHDVGKIAVPDSVLRKRGRLSPGERAILCEHAEIGARMLATTELAMFSTWVRGHHERWDGTGYPDGLSGEEIPYEARIIGLCDAYDLMLSGSSEHPPLSHNAALQEVDQGMGAAYDPALAERFLRVISAQPSAAWSMSWVE